MRKNQCEKRPDSLGPVGIAKLTALQTSHTTCMLIAARTNCARTIVYEFADLLFESSTHTHTHSLQACTSFMFAHCVSLMPPSVWNVNAMPTAVPTDLTTSEARQRARAIAASFWHERSDKGICGRQCSVAHKIRLRVTIGHCDT